MLQDNQEDKDQYCRELGAIVYEILFDSKELLSVFHELWGQYKPKTQEEAVKFINLRFGLPNSISLLCDLQKLNIPGDDEFYDLVAPLRDMALDVAIRMVSADVIVSDIITIYAEPHDDDMYIHLYLAALEPVSRRIDYMREKLHKLYYETGQLCPDLLVRDGNTDEEEESILPGEVESFQIIKSILIEALTEYIKENNSERSSRFFVAIQKYLEDFENGVESDEQFDFGFNLVTGYHENKYIQFNFESRLIQVSSGGSVYDVAVGGDSYTDWMYSIGINGYEGNNYFNCDFSAVLELVLNGAELSIDSPDEYADEMEDD